MTERRLDLRADVSGRLELTQPAVPASPVDPFALSDAEKTEADAIRAADIDSRKALHASLLTVAAGSIDRSRSAATTVASAASAIGTVYAGLLGFVFSVGGDPLPLRALLAPIFLAIAIFLSTAYLAYITAGRSDAAVDERGGWLSKSYNRVGFFVGYTKEIVERRIGVLQASVVALAVGVACLVLPFVSPGATQPQPVETVVPTVAAWPVPDPSTGRDDLDALRYQAQLDEAAAFATASAAAENATRTQAAKDAVLSSWMTEWWFFPAVIEVGVLAVVLIPRLTRPAKTVSGPTVPPPATE